MDKSYVALVFAILTLLEFQGPALAAETVLKAGASLSYEYDDNITVTPKDQITLSGGTIDGYLHSQYSTARFQAGATLALGAEHYVDADLDTDNPLLKEPSESDFEKDSQDLKADISYDWERHTLSLEGRYWRDSTLRTQFLDTGLGFRELAGTTRRTESVISPGWRWQATERQTLNTTVEWRTVDFGSDRYSDYDYLSADINWSYLLSERLYLQAQPRYGGFENDAELSVESDTLGLEVGFLWAITEKWQLDVLAGVTNVSTEYGQDGYFITNPETEQIEFISIKDQDDNGFSGSAALTFEEEYYGFSAQVFSEISPSGNGLLRQQDEGRITYHWKPRQRMRLDIDARLGRSEITDDRVNNKRDYSEAGIRLGYQFARDWWISARYRYRETENKASNLGSANGNLFSTSLSYRLPKEIL